MSSSIAHYDDYYADESLSRWRELSACDKAGNIVKAWRAIGRAEPTNIIEIGCGDGTVIQELDRNDFSASYTGFEISKSGIEKARKRKLSKSANFEIYDGMQLPVPSGAFELAVLSHVIEHVECPRTVIKEAGRVARFVFIEVPLEFNIRTPRDFHPTSVGHINLFNSLLICHLAQSA